jgi:hypothetical protein
VFTALSDSNGIYSIAACVFVAARMSHLAMNIYSEFTIPAFGRHVTTDIITIMNLFETRLK